MTTYILKDTFEQLMKREKTQQILCILKESSKEKLTRNEIIKNGIILYGLRFKSDNKGITVLRNLKTMAKYGLVEEIERQGEASKWKLNDISTELDFQITIYKHTNKLKKFSEEHDISWTSTSGITLYDLFYVVPYLKKGSQTQKEFIEIILQLQDAMKKLARFQDKTFGNMFEEKKKKANEACESYVDREILEVFSLALRYFYLSYFWTKKEHPPHFKLFKPDKFPYVLKPDLGFVKRVYRRSQYYDDYNHCTKEQLWEKLSDYELNKKLSQNLADLHSLAFDYLMHKLNFTVICDYGSPVDIISDMFKEELTFGMKDGVLVKFEFKDEPPPYKKLEIMKDLMEMLDQKGKKKSS